MIKGVGCINMGYAKDFETMQNVKRLFGIALRSKSSNEVAEIGDKLMAIAMAADDTIAHSVWAYSHRVANKLDNMLMERSFEVYGK